MVFDYSYIDTAWFIELMRDLRDGTTNADSPASSSRTMDTPEADVTKWGLFLFRFGLIIFVPILIVPILRRLYISCVHHELQNGSRVNLVQQLEALLYEFPRGDPRATHEDQAIGEIRKGSTIGKGKDRSRVDNDKLKILAQFVQDPAHLV